MVNVVDKGINYDYYDKYLGAPDGTNTMSDKLDVPEIETHQVHITTVHSDLQTTSASTIGQCVVADKGLFSLM